MASQIPVSAAQVKSLLGVSVDTYDGQIDVVIDLYDEALEAQIMPEYLGGTTAQQALIKASKTEIIAVYAAGSLPRAAVSANITSWKAGKVEERFGSSASSKQSSLTVSEPAAWKRIEQFLVEDSPYRINQTPACGIAEVAWTESAADQIIINDMLRDGC